MRLLLAIPLVRRPIVRNLGTGRLSAAWLDRAGDDDGHYYVSFGGLELVGSPPLKPITRTEHSKATNQVIYRILILYRLAGGSAFAAAMDLASPPIPARLFYLP